MNTRLHSISSSRRSHDRHKSDILCTSERTVIRVNDPHSLPPLPRLYGRVSDFASYTRRYRCSIRGTAFPSSNKRHCSDRGSRRDVRHRPFPTWPARIAVVRTSRDWISRDHVKPISHFDERTMARGVAHFNSRRYASARRVSYVRVIVLSEPHGGHVRNIYPDSNELPHGGKQLRQSHLPTISGARKYGYAVIHNWRRNFRRVAE